MTTSTRGVLATVVKPNNSIKSSSLVAKVEEVAEVTTVVAWAALSNNSEATKVAPAMRATHQCAVLSSLVRVATTCSRPTIGKVAVCHTVAVATTTSLVTRKAAVLGRLALSPQVMAGRMSLPSRVLSSEKNA